MNKALILSDLHLGNPSCRAKNIVRVLNLEDFEILFIDGDLFDCLNLGRLPKSHWKVLTKVRKVSKRRRVILIRGNHDTIDFEALEALLGIETHAEFLWEHQGKKFLFVHGDIFDHFVLGWPRVNEWLTTLYYHAHKFKPLRCLVDRILQSGNRSSAAEFRKRVEIFREHKRADYVICGHTHFAELFSTYANSGSFLGNPCTYLTIGQETDTATCGVELHQINDPETETGEEGEEKKTSPDASPAPQPALASWDGNKDEDQANKDQVAV
ncbi:MAG: UDP-2,3-diacylglucosamine diphosphatase [Limisphaerales bacterium]